MKFPSAGVYWIDSAGLAVIALMTGALYTGLIGPKLDQRAREDELSARLASMRSNLTALRTRNREFEGRMAEARAVVEAQPPLEHSDNLLTRRAAITSLLAEHNLVLDEFRSAAGDRSAGGRGGEAAAAGSRNFVRHTLALRGEGTFPDIVATASAVRRRFSDILVESVEITGHPFGTSDQRQFTLKLVWYAASG